jgi:two-component system sensor histidine kinase KdpD
MIMASKSRASTLSAVVSVFSSADPLRLERILYNLLENAAKYSPPGSKIKVSVKSEPERLVIGVSDKGRGLSPGEQARLFSPFQRLDNSKHELTRGAGLGLMACRRLGGGSWRGNLD